MTPPLSDFGIHPGDWIYHNELPAGCKGDRYRLHRFILAVPVYQWQCLVQCLTGKDAGLWFSCSPANFSVRYRAPQERA